MSAPGADQAFNRARRAKLIQMRVQGVSYDRIAVELGYATDISDGISTARKDFTRAKREARGLAEDEADAWRELESDRYDALIAAHWTMAMSGEDVRAADIVRKCIGDQADLWGIKRILVDATVTEVTQEDLALHEMIAEAKARNAVRLAALQQRALGT